jgi:hypothetical protein
MTEGRKSGETVDTVSAVEGEYGGKSGKYAGIGKGRGKGA